MICFPSPYPDELLYSLLARYYVKTGYTAYTFAAEELFQSKTIRPDMEFINAFTPDAFAMITRKKPMEAVIMEQTMFPYYGRFLPLERRQRAYNALISMEGDYHNLLAVPKRKSDANRYLRYCPLCSEKDRESYGETFWHRVHQMIGLPACPVHGCYLKDSSVIISAKAPPMLKTAEEVIPIKEEAIEANTIERRLAEYMEEVFSSEVDMFSPVMVGDFLYCKMEGSKYRSIRGEQRNISLLHADFTLFYESLSNNWFTELFQIQKLICNKRFNFCEVCMLAMFLGVPVFELVEMTLPEKTQQQRFDEEVYRLHDEGLKYPAIAKHLNASINVVKAIGERRYGTYHITPKEPAKSGVKPNNWAKIDADTLPLVQKAITQLQGNAETRPKKITIKGIERLLHLPSKRIADYLPQCREEIMKYYESQEEYWAREVVWAARKIHEEGKPLLWVRIHEMTNIRKQNLIACLPFIKNYADDDLEEEIKNLVL